MSFMHLKNRDDFNNQIYNCLLDVPFQNKRSQMQMGRNENNGLNKQCSLTLNLHLFC